MPHLTRVRIINAGHRDARMEDLTLEFVDGEDHPVDSAVWLRNGGGKSSILNLLFATVRPGKSDFLGSRAEGRQRRIEQYVLASSPAVVVCEWELNPEPGTFLEEPQRHLTGVFYEIHSSGGPSDESRLRRLFFASPVSRQDPRLTVPGLPVYINKGDTGRIWRNLAGFREEWQTIRNEQPHLQVFLTETQRDWATHLVNLGIDPELFSYQVQMNLREGGAQELFRFKESEDFVDFLLQMTLDPQHARAVSDNLEMYREKLFYHKEQLEPELDLVRGLIERFEPVVSLKEERARLSGTISELHSRLGFLSSHIDHRIQYHAKQTDLSVQAQVQMLQNADTDRKRAEINRRTAAGLRRFSAEFHLTEAQTKKTETEFRRRELERERIVWTATNPLAKALRCERKAREYRDQLNRLEEENRPLRDELHATALEYASALLFRLQACRHQEKTLREEESVAAQASKAKSQEAAACGEAAAKAEAEANLLERQISEAQEERTRLEEQDVLRQGETVSDAVARLRDERSRLHEQGKALEEEKKRLGSDLDARRRARNTEETQFARFEEESRQIEQKLQEVLKEKRAIENLPILRRVFEADTIDLDRLPDQETADMEREISDHLDKLMEIRVARAEDERAEAHLETGSLLPPTPDAEHVLELLRQHLRACWTGWQYIAENHPDNESKRDCVKHSPELATGVIVRKEDYQKALDILNRDRLSLRSPVVVASPESFARSLPGDWMAIVPHTNAYFDKTAGAEELMAVRKRLEELRAKSESLEQVRKELEDTVHRIRSFRNRFPHSWIPSAQERIERLEEKRKQIRKRIDEIDHDLQKVEEDIRKTESSIEEQRTALLLVEQRIFLLNEFDRQHRSRFADLQVRLESSRKIMQQKREERESAAREAEVLEETARRCRMESEPLGNEAKEWEIRLKNVEYLDERKPEPSRNDIGASEDRYTILKRQYESAVNASGLLDLARTYENQARGERDELERLLLDQDIPESDVIAALETLDDTQQIPHRIEMAEKAYQQGWSIHANATQAETRAAERQEKARQECDTLGEIPEVSPEIRAEGPAQADETATSLDQESRVLEKRAEDHEKAAHAAEAEAQAHKNRKDMLERDGKRTSDLRRDYADLTDRTQVIPPEPAQMETQLDEESIRNRIDEIADSFRQSREKITELDNRRNDCASKVQAFAREERFQTLKSPMIRSLGVFRSDQMEDQAPVWQRELDLRLSTIEKDMEQISAHRDVLVSQVLDLALEGCRLLRQASDNSHFRGFVNTLQGAQFLRISVKTPDDPGERKARISGLLDLFIERGSIPRDIELTQQAVRRLVQSIKVRLLHPDPDIHERYVEIPEMARFSGGEQLTSAVLLYCTLAQLRARRRGQSRARSSVLILDNPIGSVSRTRFLRIQREVAHAMGVQLIYTTAVNDHEALGSFPNLIRLRNERIDRNTGHRMVEEESEQGPVGLVEGVRVGRAESNEIVDGLNGDPLPPKETKST